MTARRKVATPHSVKLYGVAALAAAPYTVYICLFVFFAVVLNFFKESDILQIFRVYYDLML